MSSAAHWSQRAGGVIAALALAMTGAVLVPRFFGKASGPEPEIVTALKEFEAEGLTLPIDGSRAELRASSLHYARITVTLGPGAAEAEALATLDFDGRLGATEVSALSVERIPFAERDADWRPVATAAPALHAVVTALEARRRALEAGDLEALARLGPRGGEVKSTPGIAALLALAARRYRAEAWFIRIEQDGAVVKERYRLQGDLPDRPVDERGERQFSLFKRGNEYFFAGGLM